MPAITPLPPAPSTSDPANFSPKADALLSALPPMVTELNAFGAALNNLSTSSVSTTSLAIGTGSKSLNVEAGKSYLPGQTVKIAYTTDGTKWMLGDVTSYNSTTGALVVAVNTIQGAGTYATWTTTLAFAGISDQFINDLTPVTFDPAVDYVAIADGSDGNKIKKALIASAIGEIFDWPFADTPSYGLLCNGAAVSSATYAALFAKSVKYATAAISIATPAVVTWTAHPLYVNAPVKFTTTGALPTGITAGITYYVIAAGFGVNAFQISATIGGAAINTSGTQSGVHTAIHAPHGCADNLSTFNVPNIPADYTTVQASANEGVATVGEVISHNHTLGANNASNTAAGGSGYYATSPGISTGLTGGTANKAAGLHVRKCIKF